MTNVDGYTNEGYIIETNSNENIPNMIQIMSNIDGSNQNRTAVPNSSLPNYVNTHTYRNTESPDINSVFPMKGLPPTNDMNTGKLNQTNNNQMQMVSTHNNMTTPSPDYSPPMLRSISAADSSIRFSSNPNSLSSF